MKFYQNYHFWFAFGWVMFVIAMGIIIIISTHMIASGGSEFDCCDDVDPLSDSCMINCINPVSPGYQIKHNLAELDNNNKTNHTCWWPFC